VDRHPDPKGQGGLAVADGLAAVAAALVGRDAVVGVELVEGLFGLSDRVPLDVGVGVGELVGEAAVLMAVVGI
jgi:hypothetical protein